MYFLISLHIVTYRVKHLPFIGLYSEPFTVIVVTFSSFLNITMHVIRGSQQLQKMVIVTNSVLADIGL